MSVIAVLIAIGIAVPVIAIALLPHDWLRTFRIGWPFALVPLVLAGLFYDAAARGAAFAMTGDTLFLFAFITAALAIPWVLLCLAAYRMGDKARRSARNGSAAVPGEQ